MREEPVLMDGATCHTSDDTQNWMKENNINFVPFAGHPVYAKNGYPPNSPDLNPIENIFGIWQTHVNRRNPKNISELT